VIGGIICDFGKTFDSVNYDILLCKLKFYRVRSPFHKLIKSYLTNRYQTVLIESMSAYYSSYSESDKINHGIPQGFILSLLLFLFYVNDLLKIVHRKLFNTTPNQLFLQTIQV
jgi:hypothetical protein